MMDSKGCLITIGFMDGPEHVLGQLTIAPTNFAKTQWELFRKNPTAFEFCLGYLGKPDENGAIKDAELTEISLCVRQKGNKNEN